MKKTILVLCFSLITFSASPAVDTQEKASEDTAVSLKEVTPFTYCCIPHKGPFSEIEKIVGMLMGAVQRQNFGPAGAMMGIYYNSPAEVKPEELEWEIGFPITPQINAQSPLQKKQWTYTLVASALHVGPYEATGETIVKILEWMEANSYTQAGPVLEKYLDMSPSTVKPEKLRTEIWVPCKKKEG